MQSHLNFRRVFFSWAVVSTSKIGSTRNLSSLNASLLRKEAQPLSTSDISADDVSHSLADGVSLSLEKLSLRGSKFTTKAKTRVEFLVEQGLPSAHVMRLLQKPRARLLAQASNESLVSLILFFKTLNMDMDKIAVLLVKVPRILARDLDSYVKPKVQLLESLGLKREEVGVLLSRYPGILCATLGALQEHIDFLKSVPLDDETVCRIITKYPNCFWSQVEGYLKPRVEFIKSLGFSHDGLRRLFLVRPRLFGRSKDKICQMVEFLQDLGFQTGSKGFSKAFSNVATANYGTTKARFNNLLTLGFSHEETELMLQNQPVLLMKNGEDVRKKVDYVVEVMKRSSQEVLKCPVFLTLSLEGRIKPRYEAYVKWKTEKRVEKNYSLSYLFCTSDKRFRKNIQGCNL